MRAPATFEMANDSQIPVSPSGPVAIHAIGKRMIPSVSTEMAAAVRVLPAPRKLPVYARIMPMNPNVNATYRMNSDPISTTWAAFVWSAPTNAETMGSGNRKTAIPATVRTPKRTFAASPAARSARSPISALVPITAIMVGYKAIVGEIDSGTMKLLLKQPHSRADILVGKIVGRTGVVTGAIFAGLIAALVLVVVFSGSFSVGNYLALAVLTVLLALVYVSVTIAISASTQSTNLAAAGAIGVFLVFQLLWQFIPTLLRYVVNGFSLPTTQPPAWAEFVTSLNPATSYQRVMAEIMPNFPLSQPVSSGTPFYNEPWFGLVILLAWIVVPASLGYRRLRYADL